MSQPYKMMIKPRKH